MSTTHSTKTGRYSTPSLLTNKKQSGFTLIELMISITLGLLISAAAFQVFANSVNSQRVQTSAAEVQDASIFSLNYLKKEIAMANLGIDSDMRQETPWTGVVLTNSINSNKKNGQNLTLKTGNLLGIKGVDNKYLSQSNVGPDNLKPSVGSDQLTIQYQAPFNGFDCEGARINQGDRVIERFFTRVDTQKASNESNDNLAIVLACDAGRYTLPDDFDKNNITTDTLTVSGLDNAGSVLVNRVDYFEARLGIQSDDGLVYMTIEDYLKTETNGSYTNDAPIVAIQLGVITRGDSTVSGDTKQVFKLNGVDRTINLTSPSYIRRVYQGVVGLRNSRSEL